MKKARKRNKDETKIQYLRYLIEFHPFLSFIIYTSIVALMILLLWVVNNSFMLGVLIVGYVISLLPYVLYVKGSPDVLWGSSLGVFEAICFLLLIGFIFGMFGVT